MTASTNVHIRAAAAAEAYRLLQAAIAAARMAGSPRALARLRAARASVQGAARNARARQYRELRAVKAARRCYEAPERPR